MPCWTGTALLMLFLSRSALAGRCYQCVGSECQDPELISGWKQVECEDTYACLKFAFLNELYSRDCARSCAEVQKRLSPGMQLLCHQCHGYLCNASKGLEASRALRLSALLPTLAVIALR